MTYRQLWHPLTSVYDEQEARAVARLVLELRFGLTMTDIVMGREQTLPEEELSAIRSRLLTGEPVQYVLGEAAFCGRTLHVDPGVLIPRPETETLCRTVVETAEALQRIFSKARTKSRPRPLRILDIGTGSGCIAVTLALDIAQAEVMAWDISPKAVATARENALWLGARVAVTEYNALSAGDAPALSPCLQRDSRTNLPQWDIIVSNPPYVFYDERETMAPGVLQHEPQEALFAPDDNPWMLYHSIARYAAQTLRPQGMLFLETNPRMADQLALDVLAAIGSGSVTIQEDDYGKQRFVIAQKN